MGVNPQYGTRLTINKSDSGLEKLLLLMFDFCIKSIAELEKGSIKITLSWPILGKISGFTLTLSGRFSLKCYLPSPF